MCSLASLPFWSSVSTFPLGARRALAVTGITAWSGTFDALSALGAISKFASQFGYVHTLLPPDSPMPDTRQIGTAGLSHCYRNRLSKKFLKILFFPNGRRKKNPIQNSLLSFQLRVPKQETSRGGSTEQKEEEKVLFRAVFLDYY